MLENIIGWGRTMLVTASGIIIVFSVLVLLVCIIKLFGVIFTKGEKRAAKKTDVKPVEKEEIHSSKAEKTVDISDSGEIDEETLAVISAAVYSSLSSDGKKYEIKSITRGQRRRPAWATAGIIQNTEPFRL